MALTKHGFPRGYRFVPDSLEIVQLLADRLRGQHLPPPVAGIFHDIRILDYHPQQLYEQYRAYQENGCIYFFSRQEFPGNGGTPDDGKKRRPTRTAHGGGWKPSGGGKDVKRPRNMGGGVAGKMVTMVFYERVRVGAVEKLLKTDWGLHEFTVPIGPKKFSTLAVYRLYKVKNGAAKGGANHQQQQEEANDVHQQQQQQEANDVHHQQQQVPAAAVADHHMPSTSAAVAASTRQSSTWYQEQKQLMSIEQMQPYHGQYEFSVSGHNTIWSPSPVQQQFPGQSSVWAPQPVQQPGYDFQSGLVSSETTTGNNNNPGEQQQSPATDHSGFTSPVAPNTSQSATGGDETMEHNNDPFSQPEVVPPEQQHLVLASEYGEYSMDALFNEGLDNSNVVLLDPFDELLASEAGDIEFSMEDFMGTNDTDLCIEDGMNDQADGGKQDPPPTAFGFNFVYTRDASSMI
ncbi:hypothetical protein PR202_gb07986 [Eleusine coracana subsp. coracana]|uniref:NAC domain-containing protein n=1 Tax=Eleusine coracana subsp. coracana TaxID=191504 RepID=A0AAV5EDJ8_ELECO|nr:hypothetical protein PR202_gb07986 [Eleusine coracana subsp. coracana]